MTYQHKLICPAKEYCSLIHFKPRRYLCKGDGKIVHLSSQLEIECDDYPIMLNKDREAYEWWQIEDDRRRL